MERVTVVNVNPLSPIRLRNGVGDDINGCYLRPAPEKTPEPEEEEISIFDAKKYFNESGMEQSVEGKNRALSPAKAGLDRIGDDLYCGARSFNATPTASSEASWNSQTGLLRNPPGGFPVKLRGAAGGDGERKRGSAAARWLFGRKCPCSGKKSVEVEDRASPEPRKLRSGADQTDSRKPSSKSESLEPETVSISQTRNHRFSSETAAGLRSERVSAPPATGFTFPILGQSKLAPPLDPPRDSVESLEVFRPSNHKQSHQHRQVFTFPANPKSRAVDDDVASDASSDLFEIESFSTATTGTTGAAAYPVMGPRRDSLEEARRSSGGGYCRQSLDEAATPSVAATECYEPSEASIDWSVTTAEGFDRGSVTNYSVARLDQFEEVIFDRGGGGGKRRSGNGLLSCRCEKAVSVGPHPQPVARWVPPTRHSGDWATGGFGHNKPPSGLTRTAT